MKIAICDDEKIICTELEQMVFDIMEELGEVCDIQCFTDGKHLENSASEFDLVFLDIMGIDGINLAKRLRNSEEGCQLVFVTALTECMLDAFEVEAADYICKPIDRNRLEDTLKRILKKVSKEKRFFLPSDGGMKAVKISEIYSCEVMGRKIFLNTKHGVVEFYGRLKNMEDMLDFRFLKCHRSYIVNLDFMWEFKKDHITLTTGESIPVSRSKRKLAEEKIAEYIKEAK